MYSTHSHKYVLGLQHDIGNLTCKYKCILVNFQDGRCVAGAGSTEVQLSLLIEQYGSQCPGLEQYAIKKFSESLRVFPKVSLQGISLK